jgi:thymidylate synthase
MDNLYFFDKLSLAQHLKNKYCVNFIVTDAKSGKDKVADDIKDYIKKTDKIQTINPNKPNKEGKYPRFYLDHNHSIGTAYGYQLGVKHKYKEGEMDQVDRVLFDLKNNPYSRRIMTNIYTFQDLNEMHLYPCAYSMTFNVTNGKLNGILNQRSNDMVVANNWNVVQYAVLLMMFAQVSNLEVGELVHVISDAHIYDRHIPALKKMFENPQYEAPKLIMNKDVKNFYDFTVDDFKLVDYKSTPLDTKLEVAI